MATTEGCSGYDSGEGGQAMNVAGNPRRGKAQHSGSSVDRRASDRRISMQEVSMPEAPEQIWEKMSPGDVPLEMGNMEDEMGSAHDTLLSKSQEGTEVREMGIEGARTDQQQGQELVQEVGPQTDGQSQVEEECPVCTEPYETPGQRGRALLNCDHTVCQQCLTGMLKCGADRVSCPLCRQKTPLLDWEIRRMQEDAVYLVCGSHVRTTPLEPSPLPPLPLEQGRWAELERQLQTRVNAGLVCGCFRYPPRLVWLVHQLQYRCRCCYFVGLFLLYLVELSCLLLVFLPVTVLVLLFTLNAK